MKEYDELEEELTGAIVKETNMVEMTEVKEAGRKTDQKKLVKCLERAPLIVALLPDSLVQ